MGILKRLCSFGRTCISMQQEILLPFSIDTLLLPLHFPTCSSAAAGLTVANATSEICYYALNMLALQISQLYLICYP